ncbi:hypothetical protein ACSBL2_06570 [Pedobacter sp. AW31-3R]|uniref:hypothetical protein n=1 Tax=Pedobacter sp. AW31-3R TaxID=3445781 RepID=UPI003F9F766E
MKKINTQQDGIVDDFSADKKNVEIELVLSSPVDSMPYLMVYHGSFYSDDPQKVKSYTVYPFASKENHFFFELRNQENPQYFSMVLKDSTGLQYLLDDYHFEPDDKLLVQFDNQPIPNKRSRPEFSGRGAAKYNCQAAFKPVLLADKVKTKPQFNQWNAYNENNRHVRNMKLLLGLIEGFSAQLSDYSYELLKADVIAGQCRAIIANFQRKMNALWLDENMKPYLELCNYYHHTFQLDFVDSIPNHIKFTSKQYPFFIVERMICNYLEKYTRMNFVGIYHSFLKVADASLRDKMLVILILGYKTEMKDDYAYVLKHALTIIKNKECVERLKETFMLN